MKPCEICGSWYDDVAGMSCPTCSTRCPECGILYNATQLTMCPECRFQKRGEYEIPLWLRQEFATHNRKVRRNKLILVGSILLLLAIAIWVIV